MSLSNPPAQASDEPMRAALPPMPKEECLLVGVYAHRSSTMATYGAACFAAGQAATPRATAGVEQDAARFDFMMRVADNPEGVEAMAVEAIGNESMETDRPESIQMRELIDAAIAATKGAKP